MQQRIAKLSLAVLIPMAILAALLAFGLQSGSDAAGFAPAAPVENAAGSPDIVAARLISIPYGFDATLPLGPDGQSVQVGGHGECPEGGVSFRIMATVTQDGHRSRAMGLSEGECGPSGWSTMAMTPGNQSLEPGPAEACGHVIIFGTPDGALVGDWCKAVTLQ